MKKILALAACMLFLTAGMAHADYFKLTSGGTYQNVNITDPGASNQGASAGIFQVEFGSPAVLYNAFCVDYSDIDWNTGYNNFTMIGIPSPAIAPNAYKEAAWIFENYVSQGASGVAAQVAIWEVVFEQLSGGTVGDLTTADKFFVNSGVSAADLTAAGNLVTLALQNKDFDASSYRLLVSPTADGDYYGVREQDWIVRVSEPTTMILFGIGLVGLARLRRKE